MSVLCARAGVQAWPAHAARTAPFVVGALRMYTASACVCQAPEPPRLVPKAHLVAKTAVPKDPLALARAYPDHPLMQFFQRVPTEVPRAGTRGRNADERETIDVPHAVTEADLAHDSSSRSWLAPELRRKSSADLHTLWYVLLMERNRLVTSWEELKRNNAEGAAGMVGQSISFRNHRVRKSMARIKLVLNERRRALIEAQRAVREARDADASADGELFEGDGAASTGGASGGRAPATETPATETPATGAAATEVHTTAAPTTAAPTTAAPTTAAPATGTPATGTPATPA
ncbi:54S ribosomal protein L4 mitochondrial [Malassezia sp. CBS 17886]|nr:54S ribosomal protein L4 mitochondrial [Malassezia sp. CBS 17886]